MDTINLKQFSKISKMPFLQPEERIEPVDSILQKFDGEEKHTDLVNENKKIFVDYIGRCKHQFEYLASELERYHKETKDSEFKHIFLHDHLCIR